MLSSTVGILQKLSQDIADLKFWKKGVDFILVMNQPLNQRKGSKGSWQNGASSCLVHYSILEIKGIS